MKLNERQEATLRALAELREQHGGKWFSPTWLHYCAFGVHVERGYAGMTGILRGLLRHGLVEFVKVEAEPRPIGRRWRITEAGVESLCGDAATR